MSSPMYSQFKFMKIKNYQPRKCNICVIHNVTTQILQYIPAYRCFGGFGPCTWNMHFNKESTKNKASYKNT